MRRPEGSSPEGSIPGGSFEGRAIASGCEGRAEGSRSAGSVFGSSCESSRREQGRKDDIDVGTSVGCGVDISALAPIPAGVHLLPWCCCQRFSADVAVWC